MQLVFLGAPGAGKGTQARWLSKEKGIPHIATGDLLRSAVQKKTGPGLAAAQYMNAGTLVPDSITLDVLKERFAEQDTEKGYVLDGFPRNVTQAEALASMLQISGWTLTRVIYFSLDEETLVKRISGRRICPQCQAVYHLSERPPRQEGRCDCGTLLIQREDDTSETARVRFQVYQQETVPLVQYYTERHLLSAVNASAGVEEVMRQVKQAVGC